MNERVIIKSTNQNNLLKAIINYMESEKIDYILQENSLEGTTKDFKKLIYIDDGSKDFNDFFENKELSIIVISDKKEVVDGKANINYIITNQYCA